MKIVLHNNTTTATYDINVTIRRQVNADGICQHCGKTKIVRLATIEFPIEVFNLLRERDQVAEQIEAVAILTGNNIYMLNVGLICLGKFFAQFGNTVDQFLLQTIAKAAGRIERYATRIEKLSASDSAASTAVIEAVWDRCRAHFEALCNASTQHEQQNTDIDNFSAPDSVYWQTEGIEKTHPWFKLVGISFVRSLRRALWRAAQGVAENPGRFTLSEIKAQFHAWFQSRVATEIKHLQKKLQAAENVHLLGTF